LEGITNNIYTLKRQGVTFYEAGEFRAAMQAFEQCLLHFPKDAKSKTVKPFTISNHE
jgi:TolA-binding protein